VLTIFCFNKVELKEAEIALNKDNAVDLNKLADFERAFRLYKSHLKNYEQDAAKKVIGDLRKLANEKERELVELTYSAPKVPNLFLTLIVI